VIEPDVEPARLVDASGRAVRVSHDCPQCGADKAKRVASGGFGAPHDVCAVCGYEWETLTS
jgi:predicted RNA-binding Zn-ribbon protein involved in translation (DUF1610 family)